MRVGRYFGTEVMACAKRQSVSGFGAFRPRWPRMLCAPLCSLFPSFAGARPSMDLWFPGSALRTAVSCPPGPRLGYLGGMMEDKNKNKYEGKK